MTSPEATVLEKVVVRAITRRAGPGADATAVSAAVRRAFDDLAVVLVPIISEAGVDALFARALQLAQRRYPSNHAGEEPTAGASGQVSLWLEQQDPSIAPDAAAAMLETFAGLLSTLIGERLTTRYLRKAWPADFSDASQEGKKG